MNWRSEVRVWLDDDRHDLASQFYEGLTASGTAEIGDYWYLGLSYLLAGREEEARMTWLFVLAEMEETEVGARTRELVAILDAEADRQAAGENFARAWSIRWQAREIDPGYLDNLLKLIVVGARSGRFHPNQLAEWGVIERVAIGPVDPRSLEQALEVTIDRTHRYAIEFVRASLKHLDEPSRFFGRSVAAAREIAYERRIPAYSADLLEVIREEYPEELTIAVNLFWIYISVPDYPKAYRLAREIHERSSSTDLKLFSTSLLLNGMMRGSNWEEIPEIAREYKQLIERFLQEKPSSLHPLVGESLLSVMNPLSYYEDNPRENRPLLSRIGEYFQREYRETVGFRSPARPRDSRAPVNGKIKLGYMAATFRRHPVGLLSRWVMGYHDRERFSIALYLIDQWVDDITERWFFNPGDTVRQFPLDSLAIARQIREDEIDILIDLDSGTTAGVSRVMALKPAPVQVNWLGFDGSGLPAIDYLLADPYVLPEEAQTYYSEKIWRLPHAFVAVDGFEIGIPTLRREDLGIEADAIVYLSSQTALKRNPKNVELQMQILAAVPNSYFLVQGIAHEEGLRALLRTIARQVGVDEDRIKMIPLYHPTEIYRANLGIADVILDTYPFNGGTTTLEALWMGIPVVTRVGRQWSSRNGYTLLTNAGIEEGIAWDDRQYIEWGTRLGKEVEEREKVRRKLRRSRHTSPLWNAKQFTRDLEDAYRQMWRETSGHPVPI